MTKELDILVKLTDQASGPLRNVGNAAKETGAGFGTLATAAKAAGVVAVVATAFNAYTAGLTAYKGTLESTGDVELAQLSRLDAMAHAVPVVSTLYDLLAKVNDWKSSETVIKENEVRTTQVALINSLAEAYERLVVAEEASRPGQSDNFKFNASVTNELSAQLEQTKIRRVELAKEGNILLARNTEASKDGGTPDPEITHAYERVLAQYDQLDKIDAKAKEIAANKIKAAAGDLEDANTRALKQYKAKEEDLYADFDQQRTRNAAAVRQKALTEYGATLKTELDMLKGNLDDKLKAIDQQAAKDIAKRAERIEELKKGKSDEEKQKLDKMRAEDDQLTRERAEVLSQDLRDAAKNDEAFARGKDFRAQLLKDRADNLARNEQALTTRKSLSTLLIDGLTREGELGNANAKIEAERLRITVESAAKRKELNDVLTNPATSAVDRAGAMAGLSFLERDEALRKKLAGRMGGFVGSTTTSENGYFTSGIVQDTQERNRSDPALEELRKNNELLAQTVKGIDGLPKTIADALKAAGMSFIVGKL